MGNFNTTRFFLFGKAMFFPGLDLHTRCRYRFLPKFFKKGPIETLDAGCGNGALAYAAYKRGNRVLGITKDEVQVEKARRLFSFLGIEKEKLNFKLYGIYNVSQMGRKFDQIICSETLKHIKEDAKVIKGFYNILRPKGILHLCAPFALHPFHKLGCTNRLEDGGHVRDGYTLESYRAILQANGFEIINNIGLGSPLLVKINEILAKVRRKVSDFLSFPLFLILAPLQYFDYLNPDIPFSLYVQAVRKDR